MKFFQKRHSAIKRHLDTTDKMQYAFLIMFSGLSLWTIYLALKTDGYTLSASLLGKGLYTDHFMDFLNSVRDNCQANAYSSRCSIYPPLAVLFFRFIGLFIDNDTISSVFKLRKYSYYDQRIVLIFIIFIILCLFLINRLLSAKLYDRNARIRTNLLVFVLMFSYPVIYSLDRGNIVILCVVTSMFFVFFRDSESKVVRELAYISLAISAALKLYPAVFGLLLIRDKKFKDAARLILYGIAFVVVPMLLVHLGDIIMLKNMSEEELAIAAKSAVTASSYGMKNPETVAYAATHIESLWDMLKSIWNNLMRFSESKSTDISFSKLGIENIFKIPLVADYLGDTENRLPMLSFIISEAVALVLFFTADKDWKRAYFLTYILLNLSTSSSMYALTFLFIPFGLFIADHSKREIMDWVRLPLFTLLFAYLPMVYYNKLPEMIIFLKLHQLSTSILGANNLLGFSLFQLLFLTLVIPEIVRLVVLGCRKIRRRRAV